MSTLLHFVLFALSRAAREAGADPESAWTVLGLREWTESAEVRTILDRYPSLLNDMKQEFREAFRTPNACDLEGVTHFGGRSKASHRVKYPEDSSRLVPFRRVTPQSRSCPAIYDLYFEDRLARRLYRVVDGDAVGHPYELYGLQVHPGNLHSATLILASTLQETNLDVLRDDIYAEAGRDAEERQYEIEAILEVLRDAKRDGLDILTTIS